MLFGHCRCATCPGRTAARSDAVQTRDPASFFCKLGPGSADASLRLRSRCTASGTRAARADSAPKDIAQPFDFIELNRSKASFGFMLLCTTAPTAAIIAFGASDWK